MISPHFSVIIPTFNRAYILDRSVNSVLAQTMQDFELIIIDDGSTDNTEEKIRSFSDTRIKYIKQSNAGVSSARNSGLNAAKGQIITYLDSDDAYYPQYLQGVFDAKGRYGVCNHLRSLVFLNEAGEVITEKHDTNNQDGPITLQDFYDWRVKTTSSGLFHHQGATAIWRNVMIEDLDFILQLGASDPEGFSHIPETLVDYRQSYGGDGLCSKATYGLYAQAFGQIYEWHKNDPLMKNPDVYLGRVKKYKELQSQVEAGLIPPAQYKYFPELFQG